MDTSGAKVFLELNTLIYVLRKVLEILNVAIDIIFLLLLLMF